MKFGGSSVADAACLRQVAALVQVARSRPPLVVLSAMGKSTNALFAAARAAEGGDLGTAMAAAAGVFAGAEAAARELLPAPPAEFTAALRQQHDELEVLLRGVALLRELTPRTCDAIVSQGERLATAVFAALLAAQGVPCALVDARTVLRTDARFGQATPLRADIQALAATVLQPLLLAGKVVVTQGYIGGTAAGFTTTLGRGGSDWSAALLGEALGAEEVQIWTDVPGVLTADPRVVQQARPVAAMTFAEAAELAAFGAQVLHPSTIQPAVDAGIPVTVRHTRQPAGAFTTITGERRNGRQGVTALASRGPVTMLTMTSTRMLEQSGYLARLFAVFGEFGVSIDLVATAEVAVSCTVEPEAPVAQLVAALRDIAKVEVVVERAIIAVVGEGLRTTPGVVQQVFAALGDISPELISMGGNEINLSFVVPQDRERETLRRLHAQLFGAGGP
ncbi:MAG TPA: aspartate kinase [Planctomycetota bacterium]|nr:aspartate kinase [Planctomycetota bacterium]